MTPEVKICGLSTPGTLRAAIEETNALSGSDPIDFLASITLIAPVSPLLSLDDASGGTTIRGDDTGILGSYAGTGTYGFRLSSDGNKLQGLIISGFVMSGRSARAQSRAVFTAMKMLSVPPQVKLPTVSSSPPSRAAVMATTSTSNFLRLGNANGLNPFSMKYMSNASRAISLTSSPAL